MIVLVFNAGSSSIKYSLFDMHTTTVLFEENIEDIHAPSFSHHVAFEQIFNSLSKNIHFDNVTAIAHRVVHGGVQFTQPTLIDSSVLEKLHDTIPLAPLHNPVNILGIKFSMENFPGIPNIAVFDTAFHSTLPEHAYRYALPAKLQEDLGIRRFGFHGISHQYVTKVVAQAMNRPLTSLKLISLHLGNGASIAAVSNGRCVDTSMGMTPLEGLMMGSRCGDLDPGIILHLLRNGFDEKSLAKLLNHESGLMGICDVSDMREVTQLAHSGNQAAQLAIAMFCYRIKKYIGAYTAVLNGVDALIFTGGIGEHDAEIRTVCCNELDALGIALSIEENQQVVSPLTRIDSPQSNSAIYVISTNEALEIAQQAKTFLQPDK